MAKLEQAISQLSEQQGAGQGKNDQFATNTGGPVISFPGGIGDLMRDARGVGSMGGVIGNKTSEGFAAFAPVAEEHRNYPKSSAAGGVIGNKAATSLSAKVSVEPRSEPPAPQGHQSGATGGVIGNRGQVSQSATTQTESSLHRLMETRGGGGGLIDPASTGGNKGGPMGGVIGTMKLDPIDLPNVKGKGPDGNGAPGLLDMKGGGGAMGGVIGNEK